jgi:hypothetical protein
MLERNMKRRHALAQKRYQRRQERLTAFLAELARVVRMRVAIVRVYTAEASQKAFSPVPDPVHAQVQARALALATRTAKSATTQCAKYGGTTRRSLRGWSSGTTSTMPPRT